MITEIILPKLGQTMEEGTIVEWIKREGDAVRRDEILFTVETDKAVMEVEATADGFLRKILVPVGQTVPVLAVVALLTTTADEDISGYRAAQAQAEEGAVLLARGPGPCNSPGLCLLRRQLRLQVACSPHPGRARPPGKKGLTCRW